MVNELPEEVQSYFEQPFRFDDADGYVCKCSAGYTGKIPNKLLKVVNK